MLDKPGTCTKQMPIGLWSKGWGVFLSVDSPRWRFSTPYVSVSVLGLILGFAKAQEACTGGAICGTLTRN